MLSKILDELKYIIHTVAVCLTDADITTGLMDMFALECAKIVLKQIIITNSEKINLICVNASFRTADFLWLCKSIEMSTNFMEHKTLPIRI